MNNGITKSGILGVAGVEDHGTTCAGCSRPLSQYATRPAAGGGIEVVRLPDNRYCSAACEKSAQADIAWGKRYRAEQREIVKREWVFRTTEETYRPAEKITRRDGTVEYL